MEIKNSLNNIINILLVESDNKDVFRIKDLLQKAKYNNFEITISNKISDAMECIPEFQFDVILLDLILPNGEGLDVFMRIYNECSHIPIIILSEYQDEEIAVESVRYGAQDYLIKDDSLTTSLMVRSIRYAIERKKTENALKREKETSEETRKEMKILQLRLEFELNKKLDDWEEENYRMKNRTKLHISRINNAIKNISFNTA